MSQLQSRWQGWEKRWTFLASELEVWAFLVWGARWHEVCRWKQFIGLGGHWVHSERNFSLVIEADLNGLKEKSEDLKTPFWEESCLWVSEVHSLWSFTYIIYLNSTFVFPYSQVVSRSGCLMKEPPNFWKYRRGMAVLCMIQTVLVSFDGAHWHRKEGYLHCKMILYSWV